MVRTSVQTHLSRDPAVLGGALAITGTRIPVRLIGAYVREGLGMGEIRRSYPFLSTAAIKEAVAYYHSHRPEIDAELDLEERGRA